MLDCVQNVWQKLLNLVGSFLFSSIFVSRHRAPGYYNSTRKLIPLSSIFHFLVLSLFRKSKNRYTYKVGTCLLLSSGVFFSHVLLTIDMIETLKMSADFFERSLYGFIILSLSHSISLSLSLSPSLSLSRHRSINYWLN